jgi:ferric enterobactin receptor
VFRTLQMLPSVSGTGDGSASLSIRGGNPDQNLVLLDGMTVYHVDHFFGMFSAFNADALKDIQLFAGGFPAQYGGRLSSVIDLTGKAGDERVVRASVGVNLLSARGEVEIPLERGALLVSARRSYTDIIQSSAYNKLFATTGTTTSTPSTNASPGGGFSGNPFQQQSASPSFYFYDFNSKLTYRPSGRDFVAASVYSGRDNLDQSQSLGGGNGPFGGAQTTSTAGSQDLTVWGNQGVSGRWFRQWADRLSSDALVAFSRYSSDGSRTSSGGTPNGARFDFGFNETNVVRDATVRIDNDLRIASSSRIGFGAAVTHNQVDYDFAIASGDTTQRNRNTVRNGSGSLSAIYAQHEWTPISAIDVTTGVRASTYDATSSTYVEPRLSVIIQPVAWLRLKGAWGRYHQFVNRIENEDVLQGSRDFWLLAGDSLSPSAAEHKIVGVSIDRPDWAVNVEGYDKRLTDIAIFSRRYRQSFGVNTGAFLFQGDGRARGLEFLAQKKTGALTGWLSYTLAKGTDTFAAIDNGKPFASEYDQRHEAKAFGAYTMGAWQFSGTALYGSGRPYTAPQSQYQITLLDGSVQTYVHVGDKNSMRLPAYQRADIACSRLFRTDALDWRVGVSVYNLTNRRNVSYREFDLSQSPIAVTDVTQLGILPTIDLKVTLRDLHKLLGGD